MSDLLAHIAVSRLAAGRVRNRTIVLLVLVGTALPDVVAKTLLLVVDASWITTLPTHSIAGIVLMAFGASFLIEERIRAAAFLALLAGESLHVALDSLKHSLTGATYLLLPFSSRGYEAGLFASEDSLYVAPLAIAILLFFAWRDRVR